ncbi:MAG TPA: TonB-dependent receptor [Candidatus Sulfotelmatobacter sp.]|nr:TonB-dependent receptor [Candidatus Sulfotelmatobacter sp.]
MALNTLKKVLPVAIFIFFALCSVTGIAQTGAGPPPVEIRIVEAQGRVEIYSNGSTGWTAAQTNLTLHASDHIRTGRDSRVALRWSDQSIIAFGASTELEILPPNSSNDQAGLNLIQGGISFFHRDRPGHIHLLSHGSVAGVEGTEFLMAVDDTGTTTLSVVDGKIRFGNTNSVLLLTNNEQAVAEPGKNPVRTPGFIANNLLQWCFYYPAVIDPDELQFTTDEEKDLSTVIEDYREGDLLAALAHYPDGRMNISDREKIFHAALLLSVGEVGKTEEILSAITNQSDRSKRLCDSLHQLIAAVKRQPSVSSTQPQLASECLAASYFEQSRALRETSLENALHLARQAAAISPNFGFARERVAELEFSFGRMPDAMKDLDASLKLSPRNPQALVLKGFILSAQNQPKLARDSFDRALAIDSALGNAWLGRGLCKIRLRDNAGGREDLLVAAALEPQRAELRSYLGKAYAHTGDDVHAAKELALAKKLDANDPTAWLYSALLNQENNQINDAIRDLEKSQSLNDNRSVYRSQLLLDQDSAVRSANLASMYDDAGLADVSVREAGRAVSSDYANYSAHLFLANSYEQLRSPDWSNLRYDAPSSGEFWIANLLAPTGAGWLDYSVAEQPYNKLFEQNRLGVNDETTYLSRGAWQEQANQFYTSGDFSYNLGTTYRSDPGQFPNNGFKMREVDLSLKGQLTPQDSLFGTVQMLDVHNGDDGQYFDPPTMASDFSEYQKQEPNITLGYHHEWSPGVQTLFFATHRSASMSATDFTEQYDAGYIFNTLYSVGTVSPIYDAQSISPKENSIELQQIFEQPDHTTILGVRYEWGDTTYKNYEAYSPGTNFAAPGLEFVYNEFPYPPVMTDQNFTLNNRELSFYGYHTWQMFDSLAMTAGLSYDWLHEPADFSSAPFSSVEKGTAQLSPKAGIVWTPLDHTTLRAAYTRSLTGFTDSEDYRIEPTEVAGFNQSFAGLIPTSVAGDASGSRLDTVNLSLEQKIDTGTYLSLSGELLYSKLDEVAGFFNYDALSGAYANTLGQRESLNYRERSVTANVDQLLGKQWSTGAQYRLSQANLDTSYSQIPANLPAGNDVDFQQRQSADSVLQTINLHANWNSPTGLFSLLEAHWYRQNNSNGEASSEFWQFNAYAGYRFWHRRAEITFGLLNIGDQNYHLDPLNLYNDLPRNRTFLARLRFSF